MEKKKVLRSIFKLMFIVSWLTIIATIIVTFLIKPYLNMYNMGDYMIITAKIDFICLVFIFIWSKYSEYFKE